MQETLRIGNVGKAAELLSDGAVAANTPVVLTTDLLDKIAERNPDGYLLEIEELCGAMHNQIGVAVEWDGTVWLHCACVLNDAFSSFVVHVAKDGSVLSEERVSRIVSDLKGWKQSKKVVRAKEYR